MSASGVCTVLVHAKDHKVGDGFLQIPFFGSLRSRFPNARITLAVSIGGSAYASTLNEVVSPFIDEVIENAGLCLRKSQAFIWRRPFDGRGFDLVIDMQKNCWRTLAVRRVRHRLFISASRHFLFSDRWPPSFKKPERLIDQFMMLLDAVGQEPVVDLPPQRWFGPGEERVTSCPLGRLMSVSCRAPATAENAGRLIITLHSPASRHGRVAGRSLCSAPAKRTGSAPCDKGSRKR
jgi:hypothetical protein